MLQAINAGKLPERRVVHAVVIGPILPPGEGIFQTAFTLQYRQRRIRQYEMLLAAIGFFDRHVQIASPSGRIHIRNLEGTGCYVALVDLITILTHHNLRIGARDTPHDRGIPLQGIWQHVVIRGQLSAAKRHTVKHVSRCRTVSKRQLCFQGDHGTLRVGIDGVPPVLTGTVP